METILILKDNRRGFLPRFPIVGAGLVYPVRYGTNLMGHLPFLEWIKLGDRVWWGENLTRLSVFLTCRARRCRCDVSVYVGGTSLSEYFGFCKTVVVPLLSFPSPFSLFPFSHGINHHCKVIVHFLFFGVREVNCANRKVYKFTASVPICYLPRYFFVIGT